MTGFLISAQSSVFVTADSLMNAKRYAEAATAYERVYFFSPNKAERIKAAFYRAEALKQSGNYLHAYQSLERIARFEPDDSLKCAAGYQAALNLYLGGYFNDAERQCARIRSLPVSTNDYISSVMLHGFILNELHQYNDAESRFAEHASLMGRETLRDSLRHLISSSFSAKNLPRLKSLKKARRLSRVLPGAGLFYAGKPGKAFLNIGFQLLATGYTAGNIYFGNYITAASAGLFMMRSFYTGGINQLNEVVPQVNSRRASAFNQHFKKQYLHAIYHPS